MGSALGVRSLVQVAHFDGGCSCAASAKGWDAALGRSMVCSHSTCTSRTHEGGRSGVVGRSGSCHGSMVERLVVEDGISDETVIEAVAISAESLPQTFLLGPISKLDCRDYQPQAGANDACCPVPGGWPTSSLPAGRSPMRWQSFELPSRFSNERIDSRQRLSLLHGL